MYGALIYLFNKGLDDFKTPLEELLSVLRNHARDAAAVGYVTWGCCSVFLPQIVSMGIITSSDMNFVFTSTNGANTDFVTLRPTSGISLEL